MHEGIRIYYRKWTAIAENGFLLVFCVLNCLFRYDDKKWNFLTLFFAFYKLCQMRDFLFLFIDCGIFRIIFVKYITAYYCWCFRYDFAFCNWIMTDYNFWLLKNMASYFLLQHVFYKYIIECIELIFPL